MFTAECLGQFVHVAVQEFDIFHHNPCTALRINRGPGGLHGGSVGDGCVNFGFAGQWRFGLNFAGCRIENVGKAAGCAFDMFAINEMRKFLHWILPQRLKSVSAS